MKKLAFALLFIALRLSAQDTNAVIAAVDKAAAEDRFSGVVMLAKGGQPVMTKAWGYADPAKTIPNKPDTKFNLGSINKFFTKVAIGQLAAAGKLSLSDTIRKHLPDYPSPAADKITIEQLVEHRSGLGDIFGPKFMSTHAKLRTLADYEQLFATEPLLFEPGTQQKYSNAGYVVLGLIVEKVSGQSYYDYVRDHITKPLGMNDTASYAIDENVPNRAIGLTKRGPEGPLPERHANTNTLPARGSSAGGGYSTAADLLRFANALLGDKLLPERWTNWVFGGFDAKARNLGIAGGSPGVNALVEIEPPYTLIVLSNFDPPSAEQIGQAVRPLLGLKQPEHVRAGSPEPPGEVMIGGRTEAPMAFARHVPVIEGKVNGKGPYRFALDTGFAGVMMISADLAKQLGLNVVGEIMAGDPSGKNGRTVHQAHIDSFDVGNVHLGDFLAGEESDHRLEDTDGVIGLKMFQGLVLTFDYPGKKFVIDGGKLPASDPHVLRYRADRGIPNIDIDVVGTKVSMDIDAGSPALLSLPLSLAKSLPLESEPRVVGHGRTVSNEFDIYAATLKGEAHVGDVTVANPQLDFVEIFPVGNIGSRFLSQYVVTFDPANQLVRFGK
ncbi:MAG TPA: serine hydrolase [Thermoanaerobaculia bacterium]|jgi:CubicO group peptidase (beta-lactamase class C family)|nr:serine hydrolase [Thermoanaerobaculia bacterium]